MLLHSYLFRASIFPLASAGIAISKHRDEKGEIKAKIKRKANKNKSIPRPSLLQRWVRLGSYRRGAARSGGSCMHGTVEQFHLPTRNFIPALPHVRRPLTSLHLCAFSLSLRDSGKEATNMFLLPPAARAPPLSLYILSIFSLYACVYAMTSLSLATLPRPVHQMSVLLCLSTDGSEIRWREGRWPSVPHNSIPRSTAVDAHTGFRDFD